MKHIFVFHVFQLIIFFNAAKQCKQNPTRWQMPEFGYIQCLHWFQNKNNENVCSNNAESSYKVSRTGVCFTMQICVFITRANRMCLVISNEGRTFNTNPRGFEFGFCCCKL